MTFGIVKIRRDELATQTGYDAAGASVPGDAAFGPGIGAGAVAGVPALDRVRDAGPVAVRGHDVDLVAAAPQVLDPFGIEVILDRDAAGVGVDREARRRE